METKREVVVKIYTNNPAPKVEVNVEKKESLIGRRYIVKDNGGIKDYATGIERGIGLLDREVVIVSEPFVETIRVVGHPPMQRLFVRVFSLDSGRDYRVLFNEGGLID